MTNDPQRVVCWFSCGAASAVAAFLALKTYGADNVEVVYCDTSANEHPDNLRFRLDCEKWLGVPIKVIASEKYRTIEEVAEDTRYMAGPKGARCTSELKKFPRFNYQRPDDIHIFGYTADEEKRIRYIEQNNPELQFAWILRDQGLVKSDCYQILVDARIELPIMYRLGFKNNNCIGCFKASSPGYWNLIRKYFPEIFKLRCVQSRALGVRLVEISHHKRIFLDELPENINGRYIPENIPCGPECGSGVAAA